MESKKLKYENSCNKGKYNFGTPQTGFQGLQSESKIYDSIIAWVPQQYRLRSQFWIETMVAADDSGKLW